MNREVPNVVVERTVVVVMSHNLLKEYGRLAPGKGEADKLNCLCYSCMVGEVSEWATGKNQCMNFVCCCCFAPQITEQMRRDAEAKLHKANGLPGRPNQHSGEQFFYFCCADCYIKEALAAKKNFEAGVHPAGRGKKQQQKKPSPQAAAPKQHQQQQQQHKPPHKPPHKKPKPQAPPPKKSQVAPTPLAMERPAAPPPAPPALEATSNKKSDSNVLRAKALADARAALSKVGLLDLVTSVNATSEHQLLSASAFCQAEGVTEVMDIATYNLLDDFIASLGDKLGRASEGKLRAKIEASGQDAQQEEARKRADAARAKYARESSFYFVPAATLRASDEETLPRFQELKARGKEWLIRLDVPWKAACRGEFAQKILAVSHRWETHSTPDTKGVQLAEIKEYLQKHPHLEYVWYDYACMPQKSNDGADDRSVEEVEEFKAMLGRINTLYLGASVLCLIDLSYMSRFWTQFEAWLSMQEPSAAGLLPSPAERRRCTMVEIHGAPEVFNEELVKMWADKTPEQAHELLSLPDVTVTNQRDKDTQLPKLFTITELVKTTFE